MNVFIHQNNETTGPFDANTVREMLDSGEILLLTFACPEGESGWRPVAEILSRLEKVSPPVTPVPAAVAVKPPREEPKSNPTVPSANRDVPFIAEAKPLSALKIACGNCGQHIVVDASFAGMTGACPTCGSAVAIPAFAPSSASTRSEPKSESVLGKAKGFAYRFTGLQPLQDFKVSSLFSDLFKNRSRQEIDAYFNCGSPSTTPDPAALGTDLPRPWFYLRMLILGGLVLFALCYGFEKFQDSKLPPMFMIAAAFLVPLSCVALFFELNVPRNLSVYQVLKLIVLGGIVTLPVDVFISAHSKPGFFGTICSGSIDVIAQALIAVALLRGARQYKWTLNGLLAGAAVGAGFAGMESAGYLLYAFFDDMTRGDGKLTTFYAILTARAGFVPFCRIAWTASVAGTLWMVKGDGSFRFSLFLKKPFLRIFVFVIAMQVLWNSGLLLSMIERYRLFQTERAVWVITKAGQGLWVISIIGSWYLVLLLVQEGLRQVRAGGVASNEAESEPGLPS